MDCLKIYTDKYSIFSMSKETISLWFSKLKGYSIEMLAHSISELVGDHQKAFGWKDVIKKIDLLYPPEATLSQQESEWKSKMATGTQQDKQNVLFALMRGLVNQLTNKNKNESVEWEKQYAEKFVEILGKTEARKIITDINAKPASEAERKFCMYVMRNL